MNIDLAFEHALNGHAILFTGSGCSMDAINLKGENFKSAGQLASYFSELAGIDNNTNLTIAAEEYKIKFGEDKLIQILQKEFTAKRVHDAHNQIASVPWKRVYTTNYDNVMELAFSNAGKKLLPVTTDQDYSNIPKGTTLCVHLNGYIDQLNKNTLEKEFKLTEGSYVTSSISSSAWAGEFRDDIQIAKAVFFVGYSLSDLDVQRLLFETATLKDKCIFIVGEKPTNTTILRADKFGETHKISTVEFAREINDFQKHYTPPKKLDFFGECIQEYKFNKADVKIQAKDAFDLVLYGKYKPSLISLSASDGSLYYRERDHINTVFKFLDSGERVVVVHSDLGNGKTLLIEGIKILASQRGYDVFFAVNRTRELLMEIETIAQSPNKVLLVFENYYEWYDAIRYFISHANQKSAVLLSARTSAYDVTVDELYEYLKSDRVPQLNLDKLSTVDLEWVINYFDYYGLWAEKAPTSKAQKLDTLMRHPEFSSILLALLKSPNIISKFNEILKQLNEQREYYQVIISILALSVLNYRITMDKLIDIWGDMILSADFKNNPVVSQMIEFDNGEINVRSSILAKHILKLVIDAKIIVDTLVHMRRKAEEKRKVSDYFKTLAKNLVRFNNIQNLIPENYKKGAILHYYEAIKNLPSSKENPLFWLQYGIACLVLKEFDQAEKYLRTAYAYGKQAENFDVFQIDNHYARFLLEKSIENGFDPDYMTTFRQAKRIIDGQIQRERRHYPYKVAQLYADFYSAYESHFSVVEKKEIASVASDVMARIGRLPKDKTEQEYISMCMSSMQTILEKVSGIK